MIHKIKLVTVASAISVLVLTPALLYQHSKIIDQHHKIDLLSEIYQEHSQMIENLSSKIESMNVLIQTQNLISDQANYSAAEREENDQNKETNSKIKRKLSPRVLQSITAHDIGVVGHFESSCPAGWVEFTKARDKFIMGSSSQKPVGSTGGRATQSLTSE